MLRRLNCARRSPARCSNSFRQKLSDYLSLNINYFRLGRRRLTGERANVLRCSCARSLGPVVQLVVVVVVVAAAAAVVVASMRSADVSSRPSRQFHSSNLSLASIHDKHPHSRGAR